MRVLRFLLGLSTRLKIIIAVVAVALGIFAIAYFEPHKLWIDEEVNEDFPAVVAVAITTTTRGHPGYRGAYHYCSSDDHCAGCSGNNYHHFGCHVTNHRRPGTGFFSGHRGGAGGSTCHHCASCGGTRHDHDRRSGHHDDHGRSH